MSAGCPPYTGLAGLDRGACHATLFATTLTLLVIGLALALPMALRLFVANAQVATGDFANAIDMSVYFKPDVPLAKAQQLAAGARQRADVAEVTVIPADKALEEFKTYSGFGTALEVLKDNPLPHVLHVRPRAESSSPAALETLRRYFTAWPEVDIVQVDSEWVMRFNAILEVLRRLLVIVAILLGAGVLAVIGNTIRLEILNRRAEIEVTKLVGGLQQLRAPAVSLYRRAVWPGWRGVGLAHCRGCRGHPQPAGGQLAQLYGSHFLLEGPGNSDIGVLLAVGTVLGWMGAWISAARHLHSIEPRA